MRATACLCLPCRHPLRTLSLPLAVIGVALAIIGTLTFLGLFPPAMGAIGTIGTYSVMGGGAALATLALLLFCKSICCTNRNLRKWHLPCCQPSPSKVAINTPAKDLLQCATMHEAYEKMNALESKMEGQKKVRTAVYVKEVDLYLYAVKKYSKKEAIWYQHTHTQGYYYLISKKGDTWSRNTFSLNTDPSSLLQIEAFEKLQQGYTSITL